MPMDINAISRLAFRVIGLIVLVVVLLGVLTYTGVVKPRIIPGWCEVYWGTMGYATGGPKVLIVYGNDGLGNPVGACNEPGMLQCSLKDILANPEIIGVKADTMRLESVNLGNLRNYHLVIVEHAKTMETKQMRAFIDYYNQGGRLVWTGDAGTELGPDDEYLYGSERTEGDSNSIIGPWARKDGDIMVSLDLLLSVEYQQNYCETKTCPEEQPIYVGKIMPEPSKTHFLVRGMSSALPLYVFKDQDFSIVETLAGGITTEAMTLDYQSNLISPSGKDFGSRFPMIVTSGIGDRVVYYAMPLEYYANPKLYNYMGEGKPGPYFLPIENMYYGMMCG
ncbi:MAG: hypothetical protein JW772_04600 [Candidatus Diapherotrites archaeon]|nr:hypothetical protein [Candidatus Diapherotrites archaeon]